MYSIPLHLYRFPSGVINVSVSNILIKKTLSILHLLLFLTFEFYPIPKKNLSINHSIVILHCALLLTAAQNKTITHTEHWSPPCFIYSKATFFILCYFWNFRLEHVTVGVGIVKSVYVHLICWRLKVVYYFNVPKLSSL